MADKQPSAKKPAAAKPAAGDKGKKPAAKPAAKAAPVKAVPVKKAAPAKVAKKSDGKPKQDLSIKTPLGISVGLHRGHPVTKRKPRARITDQRRVGKRTKFVREVIREVSGYAPYERRIIELMRVGLDKRALKLAKRKIGTHRRAVKKREEMGNVVSAQRLATAKQSQE